MQEVFYTTAVGGSTQYPEGDKGVVYVSRPGTTEWSVLSEAMKEVPLSISPHCISSSL